MSFSEKHSSMEKDLRMSKAFPLAVRTLLKLLHDYCNESLGYPELAADTCSIEHFRLSRLRADAADVNGDVAAHAKPHYRFDGELGVICRIIYIEIDRGLGGSVPVEFLLFRLENYECARRFAFPPISLLDCRCRCVRCILISEIYEPAGNS
ncbi:hypothetical protein EVAR_3051_1 [Eumeta japonica]|uniref:Uncharacterized protein n=1 Tax=Eumeta variegata TaxID=151549 RepID=A0A4C1SUF6_EUMVA|nr:hypothetical protein EVAR_3051_1 [Eumeta japonica]